MTRCFLFGLLVLIPLAERLSAQSFTDQSVRITATPTGVSARGITVSDFNGDGRSDIYFPGRLLLQGADGMYRDALLGSAISVEGQGPLIGLPGDPNADGLTDLLIVDTAPGSRYYENTNTIRYRLANGERSLNIRTFSAGALWGNFDGEGGVDLFVASRDGDNRLYLSSLNDDFTDVSDTKRSQTSGGVCGLAVNDWDHDLDLDVYLPMCDGNPVNQLLQYDSVRDRYGDIAGQRGVQSFRFSHAAVWFDYNNDGWDDLFVVNARFDIENGRNQLFRNEGGTGFTEVAAQAGLEGSPPEQRRGVAAADFDNDGWTDLYISFDTAAHELFRNLGDGTFENVTQEWLPATPSTEAFAAADVDDNGWIDLLYHQSGGTTLLMNDGTAHWTRIALRAGDRNRRGLGARVTVTAGDLVQTKQMLMGGGNPRHEQEARLHFGLGTNETIDRIDIVWEDGTSDVLTDLSVDTELVINKGGQLNPPPSPFSLAGPIDGAFFDTSAAAIDLSWEPSSDSGSLQYTATLWGPGTRLRFPDLNSTTVGLDPDLLAPNQVYTWSVYADDGFSVTAAEKPHVFTFGDAAGAVATLTPPAIFDFGLPTPSAGDLAFLDLDLDGDLDLFVAGSQEGLAVGGIYSAEDQGVLSTSGGEFIFKGLVNTGAALPPLTQQTVAVGDLDGDGRIDIALAGIHRDTGVPSLTFFQNRTGGLSSTTVDLPARFGGPLEIADVDGDGDGDLLMSGSTTAAPPYDPATVLYENTGSTFVEWAVFPGAMFGGASWADADGDGDLDLALVGDTGNGLAAGAVYRNDGASFERIDLPDAHLLSSSVDWGDYDNDGLADLLITGGVISPELMEGRTILYRQVPGMVFEEQRTALRDVLAGQGVFGDYENDGDLDILLTGIGTVLGERVGRVYRNQDGGFVPEVDFQGALNGRLAVGDYNLDGDLDFVVLGVGPNGTGSLLFFINQQVAEPVPSTR